MKTEFYKSNIAKVAGDAYISALIKLKEAGITSDMHLSAQLTHETLLEEIVGKESIHSCDILDNVLENGTRDLSQNIATVVVREVSQYKEFNKKLSEYVQMLEKSTTAAIAPMQLPEIHRSSVNGYALTILEEKGEEIVNAVASWKSPSIPDSTLNLLTSRDYDMSKAVSRIANDISYRAVIARNFLRTEVTPMQVTAVIAYLVGKDVIIPKTIENATIMCILADHFATAYSDSSLKEWAYGCLNLTTINHMLAVKEDRVVLDSFNYKNVDHLVVCDTTVDQVADVEVIFGGWKKHRDNIENFSVSTFVDSADEFRTYFQAQEVNYHEAQRGFRKENMRKGINHVFEDFIRSGLIESTGFANLDKEDIIVELYHVYNDIANTKEGLDSEYVIEYLFKRVLFAHTNFPVFMETSERYAKLKDSVSVGIAFSVYSMIAKFLVARCVRG